MESLEKLSLQKIDVTGNVIGKFSTFRILQEYTNATDSVLEVIYTFPVSATATVTGFTAQVGEKIIKGKVREKEEARKEYEKAMVKGDSAYMMTNEESNIFRMNIGKIAIGETVVIQIDYIDNFEIVDNQIRMFIPTLVPPRYKSAVTDLLFYAKNEVEYRGNITIRLDKDLKINDVESKTHSIKLENNTITANNIKLDRDFVLDIKLAEQSFSKGYRCDLPNGKQLVYLSFFPEIETDKKHVPKDYMFVMDISGSMRGYKLDQTKEAVIKCLKQLREGDRFNIIAFESSFELFSTKIMEYNPENFVKAQKYVESLYARGGTEMFSAVKAATKLFGNENIIFLFTDGDVGNEDRITGYVREHIGKSSLFVFGIDTSVNKKGLQAIADAGRGKAEFIVRDEQIKEIILRQFARVSSSNLFDIALNPKSNKVADRIEKQRMLFNHDYYDVLVEVDAIVDDFELQCKTDTQTYSFVISKDTLERPEAPLHTIYASELIRRAEKYIEARPYDSNKGYKEQIVEIAVEYQIDSKYTAFIAVNERDEKLTDIPLLQETVLEAPSGWGMRLNTYSSNSCHADSACMERNLTGSYSSSGFAHSLLSEDNEVCSYKASPKKQASKQSKSIAESLKQVFYDMFIDEDDQPSAEEIALKVLFQKIEECEALIVKQEAYQSLLDEIIELLNDLTSFHTCGFQVWKNKVQKKAPIVYALIKAYIEKAD